MNNLNKKEILKFTLLVGVLVAMVTTFVAWGAFISFFKNNPEAASSLIGPIASKDDRIYLYPSEANVVETVRKVNPAVVAITISKNVPVYERYFEPSPFGDIFGGDYFFSIPQLRQKGTELQEVGGGSGFIVSSDGYIVTNRHVVIDENAEYTVFTNDGKKYPAKVIARDPALDIAIIKIEGRNFEHLDFGRSNNLQIGQTVIAIGNALGEFRNTVSVGVVSGLARSIMASDRQGRIETLDRLIQTDAAINQGNSGGPLLNLSGEVIGVNVAVASGAENIGFALSSESVKNAVESVKRTGRIVRPYLGVRYIPIDESVKEENNLAVDYGVLVKRGATAGDVAVSRGSPADKAGIKENDIILEIDGIKLDSEDGQNLASILREKKVGESIRLRVLSGGREKNVSVVLEEMKM